MKLFNILKIKKIKKSGINPTTEFEYNEKVVDSHIYTVPTVDSWDTTWKINWKSSISIEAAAIYYVETILSNTNRIAPLYVLTVNGKQNVKYQSQTYEKHFYEIGNNLSALSDYIKRSSHKKSETNTAISAVIDEIYKIGKKESLITGFSLDKEKAQKYITFKYSLEMSDSELNDAWAKKAERHCFDNDSSHTIDALIGENKQYISSSAKAFFLTSCQKKRPFDFIIWKIIRNQITLKEKMSNTAFDFFSKNQEIFIRLFSFYGVEGIHFSSETQLQLLFHRTYKEAVKFFEENKEKLTAYIIAANLINKEISNKQLCIFFLQSEYEHTSKIKNYFADMRDKNGWISDEKMYEVCKNL